MGDSAPDAVVFLIDPKHSHSYAGASGRTASFRIAAKTIDAAVQRYEHTGCIDHTDRSHIAVADGILFERLFIRIFTRLFDRGCHLYLISVAALYRKDFNENPLPGLELCAGVQKPLVTQFPEWNINLKAEKVHKDACPDYRYDSRFRTDIVIDQVITIPVCAKVILFALGRHCLKAAGHCNTGLGVNAFHDIIDFGTESLCKHIVHDVRFGTTSEILRRFNCFFCRNNDLEVTMINDCQRTVWVIFGALNTLDCTCQNSFRFHRLDQIQQIVLGFVSICLDRKTLIKNCSKGMRQRAALLAALIHSPELVFLDEPTSGLDPAARAEVHKMLGELKRLGTTVFLTTHDMAEAETCCDRLAILNAGRIIAAGTPASLTMEHARNRMVVTTRTHGVLEFTKDAAAAQAVYDLLAANNVTSIHSDEPNLEEVFLELTGREL